MPLRGQGHSDLVKDKAPYFVSLAQLDTWSARPHYKLDGVLPFIPRPHADDQSDARGKLLVCHDFKGGYDESPSELSYTFNFWRLCDTFVYFSHHRVTVPPSGWTNAAHKQGTKMLGTLIFENSTDCLQLVVGHQGSVITDNNIPVSKRYAILLAELAYQRGFDGYLLNVEAKLQHHTNHARALASWMLLLRAELRAKVGPHAQVVWYDSIKYDGTVQYQNRLNGHNLPFFLASDAFFTNYWWEPETQRSMLEYLTRLHQHSSSGDETSWTKALQSIYAGVDVWPGRGQYGNSGFNCYRALTYTTPLGFSAAVFAPGWTWESTTNPERNWHTWREKERRLWVGPLRPGETIDVPESPEGPFKPITAFFQDMSPPDPARCAFYTHFSPGVGYSWFVEGRKVLETQNGWLDIDKQTSIGNLIWPWPSLRGVLPNGAVVTALSGLDVTDGYNGGNSLKLTLTYTANKRDDAVRNLWVPVQSLTLTTGTPFEARIVQKTTLTGQGAVFDPRIDVRALSEEGSGDVRLTIDRIITASLSQGWTQQTIVFIPTSTRPLASVAIGFRFNITPSIPTNIYVTFALSLGQLAVYPAPPPSVTIGIPSTIAANFAPARAGSHEGVLTWDTASTFLPINVRVEDAESITPAWLLKDTPAYRFPTFIYFNVYATPLVGDGEGDGDGAHAHADAVFIGTTGLDGRANRFHVDPACFPDGWDHRVGVRFSIQGVTDRGEVLPWERCTTVDLAAASAA